ncbi:VWA domain-containing protein [Glycomyces scopariae]|uniref:Ca-activated chloride channel family protein n=1 Tax=Glycomyces sambucus TaxID=380244 RepID=A0A1G9IE28_9ACTN|nr:VWA domain-containing protein [Glycomyces sambucus]SDL23459.1 Ca-activated chloride channel family protein [Glycomyces sambucus]
MIRLLEPAWLLALVPVAILAGVYVWAQFARQRVAVRFANASLLAKLVPRLPGWRRHLPAGLLVIALAVLVGGMTRPAVDVEEPQERATVILAIDVSLSMMASDVDPTRIDAAKAAASDFVAELPEQYNVGLVSFAGFASVVVPPTKNRAEVTTAINGLTLAEATATGDAVFASLQAVQQVMADESGQLAPARILLLSDGYRTAGRTVEEAGEAAAAAEIPVSTVAFGTDEGVIELDEELVSVPVDRDALAGLAEATGGDYYEAVTAEQLRAVYEDMGSSLGYRTIAEDVSQWFIGTAMVLLFAAAGLSLAWTSRLT